MVLGWIALSVSVQQHTQTCEKGIITQVFAAASAQYANHYGSAGDKELQTASVFAPLTSTAVLSACVRMCAGGSSRVRVQLMAAQQLTTDCDLALPFITAIM